MDVGIRQSKAISAKRKQMQPGKGSASKSRRKGINKIWRHKRNIPDFCHRDRISCEFRRTEMGDVHEVIHGFLPSERP